MTKVIKIDRKNMTINGQPATERDIVVAANQIYGQPKRFQPLLIDLHKGQYQYTDLDSEVQP